MESIHKSSARCWISDHVNLRKFRDDWCVALPVTENYNLCSETLSSSEYDEVKKTCGLAAMKCSFQNKLETSKDLIIPGGVDLETLRLQKEDLEKRKLDLQYDSLVYCNLKFHNYPAHKMPNYKLSSTDEEQIQVKEPEVILCVQIFRPELRGSSYMKTNNARLSFFQVDQEFMVLGSQYLTELRDKISCVSDQAIPGDYSELPELTIEVTCKDLYKSGYFYIDGVFYNDMRHPDCRDYSQIIIDWSKSKGRGIGPFKKASMEETAFIDLSIQLGYPYLYVHQGNCEHLIVFYDLLMYTHHYSSNRHDYPAHLSLRPKKRVFCMICRAHTAEWITYDNNRVPESPFFFCKLCFFNFNYGEDDQKIGNFQAYHYIDRSNIL